MTVSVCIATFRRPDNLAALLSDLALQRHLPAEVVVVDNDANESARTVVERHREVAPYTVRYAVQPRQNISLTRNRTVELATGTWLAFLDDDERVPSSWLRQLLGTIDLHCADGALGPVVPVVPETAPKWIRRGNFYDWARMKTGRVVPRNRLRFGNVVLRASLLRKYPMPFDPAYGLTGGEDGDLLTRLVNNGARIVWCDEGIVTEPVVPARLSLRWLMRRALRGGQDFGRHFRSGRYGRVDETPSRLERAAFVAKAVVQLTLAGALAVLFAPIGRHISAYWLLKCAANTGKLSVFFGWHYQEYAEGVAVTGNARA